VSTPTQISRFDADEFLVTGIARLIGAEQGKIRLAVPVDMKYRNVYLFLEAVTSGALDFEVQAELQFIRNGVGIHEMPASIAINTGGTFVRSRLNSFPNAAAGSPECLSVVLGSPQIGGAGNVTLTPQKVQIECDEVWLNLRGSAVASAGTFISYRGLLAVRSSLSSL